MGRTITKDKPPSDAQARRLAAMWGRNEFIQINDSYVEPTTKVLLARGWLMATGAFGKNPSGSSYQLHRIGPDGVSALATYFINKSHGK